MKRLLPTSALAWQLATACAHAAWRASNAIVGARNAMSLTMPGMGMDMDSKPRHKEGM
jgi:hypothetical protein